MDYSQMELKLAPVSGYDEIGQQSNVKFSMAVVEDNCLKQLFSPIKCRDFLNEVVRKQYQPAFSERIYSFPITAVPVFDHANPPILLAHFFPKRKLKKIQELFPDVYFSEVIEGNVLIIPLQNLEYMSTFLMSYISHIIRVVEQYNDVFDISTWTKYSNEQDYAKNLIKLCRTEYAHIFNFFVDCKDTIARHTGGTGMDEVESMKNRTTYHNGAGMLGVMRYKNNKVRLMFEDWWNDAYGEDV